MKSLRKITVLADIFERKLVKLADDMASSQPKEAADFFFGVGYNLSKFQNALGKLSQEGNQVIGDQSVAKILANYFNTKKDNASVTVGVEVIPQKGARWILNVSPPALKQTIQAELDKQFKSLTGKSMAQALQEADAAAKKTSHVEGSTSATVSDMAV